MSDCYGTCGACGADLLFGMRHGCPPEHLPAARALLRRQLSSGLISAQLSDEDLLAYFSRCHLPDPVLVPRTVYLRHWQRVVAAWQRCRPEEVVGWPVVEEALLAQRSLCAQGRASEGEVTFDPELMERLLVLRRALPAALREAVLGS